MKVTYLKFLEHEVGSTAPLFIDHPVEPESNVTDGIEYPPRQSANQSLKAIATKTKEIEQVYRQDCGNFWDGCEMLIEKDPSLEKSVQFALIQNLHEISERVLKNSSILLQSMTPSSQDFGESVFRLLSQAKKISRFFPPGLCKSLIYGIFVKRNTL